MGKQRHADCHHTYHGSDSTVKRYKRGVKECRRSYVVYSSVLPSQEMCPVKRRIRWYERPNAADGLHYYRRVRDMKKVSSILDHIVAAGGKGEVWRKVELHYRNGGACYFTDRTYHFGGYRDD